MILFENVTKTYPRTTRPALDDVNLEIPRGEFVFVVGTSGSGKSTMLQLVMKEQDVTRGRILVAGRDLDRLPERKVPGPAPRDRLRLPGLPPAAQQDGLPERRLRPAGPRQQPRPHPPDRARDARARRSRPAWRSACRTSSPAASSSASPSPAPSSTGRRSCSPTSPPATSTPTSSLGSSSCSTASTAPGTTVVMATHDTVTVNAMRKRVIRLDRGRARQRHGGRRLHDGLHPAHPARRGGRRAAPRRRARGVRRLRRRGPHGIRPRTATTGDADLPPIGRDADAPRAKSGIFRRHKAVQTSDR